MNEEVTKKTLREFGLLIAGVALVYALWPLVFRGEAVREWAAGIAALFGLTGLAAPSALKYPYRGWMMVGHALGWFNTRVLLGLLYYGLVVPMGLAMKMMGKDPMRRSLVPGMQSYRVERTPRPASHMKNMF
ncbi:hypothetical protein YTPLAS18_24180 [Nitrospira sp.]|nr:hypothetical protein YTPLAS18_24180 [Nitrospira sp.]